MSLEHFVEHYRPDIATYNKVVTARKITESEVHQIKNNMGKLSESTKKYVEDNPVINLFEKTVYRVPISRYDWKNANGRIYSRKLWENVIRTQKDSYQGGIGLADHPDDDKDGSFKDQSVVWLNMGLTEGNTEEDKIVWAECVFVGTHGRLAEEIMEAGGRVGFSSSGFGELEESSKENVRWDTYLLERVSDLVLNPSQGVYGKAGMKIKKEDTNPEEYLSGTPKGKSPKEAWELWHNEEDPFPGKLTKKDKRPDIENKTNESIHIDNQEENHPMSMTESTTKVSKLEERKFRKDVALFLSEAIDIKDSFERLEQLNEIQSYFAEGVATDLKDKVKSYIAETNLEINTAVKEYSKIKEDFEVASSDEIKEGLSKLATDNLFHERTASEWKGIAVGLQEKNKKLSSVLSVRPTAEAYKEAVMFAKKVKDAFVEKEQDWKKSMSSLREAYNKQVAINQSMTNELAKFSSENDSLKEKSGKYKAYITKLKETIFEYEDMIEKRAKRIEENKLKESTISIKPKTASTSMFQGFNESNQVFDYFKDLVTRHGSDIIPYKEAIQSCKTLKEAMRVYNRILSEMGRDESIKISEALEPEERQRIIESQTRTKVSTRKDMALRKPEGWD